MSLIFPSILSLLFIIFFTHQDGIKVPEPLSPSPEVTHNYAVLHEITISSASLYAFKTTEALLLLAYLKIDLVFLNQ